MIGVKPSGQAALGSAVTGGQREELRRGRIRWRDAKEATEVFNQQITTHQINVAWMRQVMRADKDVIRCYRHIFRQLPLNREITLIRIRVFKLLSRKSVNGRIVPNPGKVWSLKRWRPS